MTELHGQLYAARSSRALPAILKVYRNGECGVVGEAARFRFSELKVTSRLGDTPRHITLSDGRKFETLDNDGLDALQRALSPQPWQALRYRLESRLGYMLITLVFGILFTWGLLAHGLPALSERVAMSMPPVVTARLGEEVLALLDEGLLYESRLEEATRWRLRQGFERLVAMQNEAGFNYRLHFRRGGPRIGANAFALPSGSIVVTDELVALAESDDEVLAVLAHELGHVVHRHGLRQLLQGSLLTLFITYTTGDPSALVVALPSMLLELGYSREFELEVDSFAVLTLEQMGLSREQLASMLEKLEASHRPLAEGEEGEGFDYLSTHPATAERIRRIRGL